MSGQGGVRGVDNDPTVDAASGRWSVTEVYEAVAGSVWPAPFVPGDFQSIATVTVGSGGASSIEFTSIPGTYQHLQLRGIVRNASTNGNDLYLQFNNNTGASYTFHQLYGNGSSAGASGSTGVTGASMAQTANTANTFGAFVIDILDYASTSKNPVFRCFGGYDVNGGGLISIRSSMYNGTGAITSIKLYQGGSVNQEQYSTAALYGVKA